MIETLTFRDQVESVRPPGAAKRETKVLFLTALRFRDGLDDCLEGIESDAFLLDEDEVDELAIALTELAEDLHADAGLWRSLEAYHQDFFGVSLPLLCKPGDQAFETFDAPEHEKLFMSVRVAPTGRPGEHWLVLEHATHALSSGTEHKFARYWRVIKPIEIGRAHV